MAHGTEAGTLQSRVKDCFSVDGSCGQAVNATLRTTLALAAMDPADIPDEVLASRCNKADYFCCACCTGQFISLAYLCMLDAVQRCIAARVRKACSVQVIASYFDGTPPSYLENREHAGGDVVEQDTDENDGGAASNVAKARRTSQTAPHRSGAYAPAVESEFLSRIVPDSDPVKLMTSPKSRELVRVYLRKFHGCVVRSHAGHTFVLALVLCCAECEPCRFGIASPSERIVSR